MSSSWLVGVTARSVRDGSLASLPLVVAVSVPILLILFLASPTSPDLAALYFAGSILDAGQPEDLYLMRGYMRTMLAADGWQAHADAIGFLGDAVYPYVYPPLWAALSAPLTRILSPEAFFGLASLVQAPMIPASVWLAHRILRPAGQPLLLWMLVVPGLILGSFIGLEAVLLAQPQITVTFLMLLAVERSRSGRPVTAGAALALAAALKLYPALLVLWWLAERRRTETLAFAGVGAVLAGLSVALAGWDLHLAFIERVQGVSAQVVGGYNNFNLENLVFQIAHADALLPGHVIGDVGFHARFWAFEPGWMRPAVLAAVVCGLALIVARWRAGDAQWRLRALLPASFILLSLGLPMGWAYQYLLTLVLLPALVLVHPGRTGWLAIVGFLLVMSPPVLAVLRATPFPVMLDVAAAVAALVCLFMLFVLAPAPRPPLHRAPAPL
jgi:alpha-1,2-mannosyltransferase